MLEKLRSVGVTEPQLNTSRPKEKPRDVRPGGPGGGGRRREEGFGGVCAGIRGEERRDEPGCAGGMEQRYSKAETLALRRKHIG